jgi:hypothetical protein
MRGELFARSPGIVSFWDFIRAKMGRAATSNHSRHSPQTMDTTRLTIDNPIQSADAERANPARLNRHATDYPGEKITGPMRLARGGAPRHPPIGHAASQPEISVVKDFPTSGVVAMMKSPRGGRSGGVALNSTSCRDIPAPAYAL